MSTSSESDQWSSSDNEQEISSYSDDSATSVGELEFHSAEEFSPSDEEPNNEEPARRTTRSRPGNQRSGNPRLRRMVKPQPEPDSVILAEVDRRLDEVDLVRPTEPPIVQTELTEPERIMAPFINQMGGADYKACVEELAQFTPHGLRGVRIELQTSNSVPGLHILIATLGDLQIYAEQFLHEINFDSGVLLIADC
jgi:hypothetical protein